MNKKYECTICKHYGRPTFDKSTLERQSLYDDQGNPIPVILCRKHAVQLFQSGQKKFLISHYRILNDLIASDEMKFLELMERTVRANLDMIS
ncbi:MAG: hypothetical protein CME64_02595 [Halobacteriovoraceae bacterium]|nr:hypothetical protein [Halobacteriovoraceae bacterium]|tara:strand:- start:7002 stop:7277 length:276 start_codon:yes stop_codon:yes gene_type:complete